MKALGAPTPAWVLGGGGWGPGLHAVEKGWIESLGALFEISQGLGGQGPEFGRRNALWP